ncbi:MAG TPA: DUF4430 domain-containing protein [Acholeplasma sp.]|nr:DUF4430 domain-containing protein [Acholeplasma sp.]
MKRRDLLLFAFLVLVVVGLIFGVKIESVDEYYLRNTENITEDSEVVYLQIECKVLINKTENIKQSLLDEGIIPDDGIFLKEKTLVLRNKDTVMSILKRASRYYRFNLEGEGLNGSYYIEGIYDLYEFDCGPLSGWLFYVNGERSGQSSDKVYLENGDKVVLKYSCDMGNDLLGDVHE